MPSEVSTLEAELTADEGRLQAEIPKTEATVAFDTELTESVIEVADVDAMADRDMLQVDLPKSDSDVTEGQSRTQTVIKISEVCFTLQMDTMQDEIATAEVTVTSGSEVVEPEICRPSTESERVEFEIAKAEPEVTLDIVTLKPSIAKIEPDLRPDTDGLQTEQLKVKIDLSSDIDRVTPEKSETDTDVTPERETLLSDIPSPKADVVSGSKRKLSITGIQCFTIEDTDTAVTGIQRLKTEDTYTVLTGIQSVKIEETDTAVTGIAHLIIEDSETVITGIQSLKSEDTHIAVTGIHSLKIEDTDTADTGVRILQIEDTDTADTGVRILQTEDTNTAVTGIHSLKIEDTDTAVTGVRILQIEDTDAAVTGVRILQIEDTDTAVTGVRSLKTVDTDTVATGIQSLKTEDTDTAVTGTISSEKLDNEIAVKEKYLSYQQDSEMPKPDFTTYVEEVAREPRVEVHGESTETLQEVLLVSRNVHWPTTVQSVEHVESLSTATLLTDDPSVSISSQPRKTHAEQMDSDILPTQPLGTWTSIHSMTQHIISESADSDSSSLGPGLPQSRPWDLRHRVAHLSSLQPPDPDAQEDTGSGSSSLPTATLKTGHTKSQKGVNQGSSCVPQQWERRGGDLVTGPAEARSGVESGAESASQPTMTELLMDCLQLERQEASSSIKGRSPLWDAMVCIDTSPRNQENHLILSRVAFRILCCQNQPARISTTAMVQQVDEAKACQQCVLEKLDALPSAGIALETVHPTERQWKAILQDASAAVQMKEAQMQLVSQYEEKRQTAEGALAKLKVELKAACGDTTECMTLQEEQLRGFLQNLEQESSTMAAVLQVFPQVSPVLDEDDRTGTLIQLEDLQGHWWTLQRVAERALYHATAYVQESATLLREAQDLHKQLKALQASELFQSRSGNCASVQLVFFGATLAATEYQYDKLNQLFEALNQSLAGETERRDIRLALQSLKEGLDLVKTQLSEMSISVISDALSKIMKVMQDHLTWAKKMEIKITEKMRKLDLFPEKVHRQIFELKKLKCEIQSKQIQLESLVEDVKELTPVLDEKELPPLLSLVDTLKDLTKSAADNSVRALLDVKLSLQMKEKLFEQITNVDAWVAKHVEKEMTSWANQPDSEPGIASRLRHRMAELKEAEKHSAVIMTLLNKAGEMAPQLSLADRCKLHDLLIDHQGTIHGIITSERKGCRELEDLRQARVSSLETLASIEAGLRQIDLDLTKHKFPVTKDSLTILEHYRYLLLKHRWQVERLHHCKRDKRRELQRVMVDLQKKINSLGLQAEAHGKYLSSKKQMEDWRQNLEKQALQLKDEKISKVERFRSCHILSVQFSLTKNICQEVTNQLNNISQDLYPSQLNSERQKIRHTMQGLASWEMAIHNDLKILESALLEGKCYFAELHAMLEFLRDAQHKLDHALPVSPDEQAIDRELLWCLSIEKRAESGKRALEALKYRTGTRQDKLESKHSELTDLIEKVLKESHLRTGSLHQAKEALRVYSAAVCGAADFFQDAESQLLPVLSETSGCADELQCLTAASASLTQGFGHLLSRLQELLPLRTCLSVSQVEQIHMCVMSHLLVTLAMLQARAQLQHEALQSCTKRQNLYRKSLDDICHHVEHLEKSLSECVSHKVTSLQECSDLQEKLKALEQEAESHSRALRGTLTDLWLHCPKPGCGSKDEAEAVTLRRRLAGLHHSACDLRGCWERRAAEWKGIALSMEGAQKVREQLEDEIPPSPREGALQEELQNLLPDTEKYLESLNSELCVLASLEMRLPRTLGDPAKKEQATPSQFSQDLQAIRESYRKLTEKSMLGRQAASVELHDREKVREEIYGMRERLRVASCRLASLEHFACQSRLQEVRLELSSQRAVLRGIMEGLRVKYPSSFPLVPLEVQKPLQEVTHLLEELEEKLAETAEKISPVRRLGVGVTQVTGGLRLVMSLLEQKSSTVVEAEYLQKRVWDELDRWHTQLAALESEVADMSQDQPELAHNLMDQLTEPLQLYQKVVKQAEQRTAFLSKIPACLQEYEEIMASSNSWLREAKGWLNTPCSYTSARSLSSHVHALQVLLEDSEQMRATLQAFTPFLKEISTVCNTMALEQRLNQADEHVASMQQSIVGPLTQLQNTAAGVDAIEAEVKFMEKNVTKIRAILSSLDSESASPEEHLRDWQVILDNIQAMKRTITEIQNCKPSLGLPREAEEALDVFQRAQDLLPPIQDLEQETVTQIATIKISASYELKYMRKIRSIADDAVDPRGIICAVEGKVWETSLSEEEEEGSTHSSSSDTLIGSVSEGPDDTAEEPAFPAEGTMGAAGGGGAQHGDLVVGAACGGVDFGDGLNVGVLETPEPHLIPTTKSAIAWKEEDRFPEPIIKQIFDPHDKYMFRSSTPSSEILKDDHQAEVMGDVFGPPLSVSASLETDYDSQLSATIPRENVSVSQEALSLLYKRNLSLPEETKSVRQHTVSVPQRDVSAPAKTTSVTNDTASVPLCVVSISEETLSVILETVSVPKRDVPAPKETTSVTRDTASVPTRDVSAPKETVSAAKDMLSVPQKDDLASAEYKSVTQETVSVPDMNESAPKETTPVTQETVSVCQTDAVPLRADTSFTQETVSVHKKDVAATAETISVTHDALSVAKRDMSTSKKTISVTEEKMSVPNKDVTATKETILVTQETMSVPKRDVSTPKKTLSAIQETVSVLKMDVSAPKASASVTRETVSIHEKDVSDLTETISVALDTMSVLQKDMSTPAKTISETLETVSVPKRDVTATKETISVTQETVSIPKRHVKATKETVSSPQDTLSIPQKDVSATAKSISVAPDTMSVLQKDVSPLAETISETQETVSVPKRDVTATKETISVTQETVSIPKRDVSAPKETVSSPEEILSVPQKDVSARKETTSVTQDTVSIPKRDVSAPKETVSAPQEMLSVPQKDVSDPTETISVALDTMSVLQKDVSTPAETISETLETVSVPKRDVSATKETISVTQETVSAPKRDVKATKETISVTQETVSIPKRDVKATKETISVTQETVSAPKRDVSAPKETASAAQDTLSIPQKDVSAPAKSISVALDTMSVLQKDVSAPKETVSAPQEMLSIPQKDVSAHKETTSVTRDTVSIPEKDVSALAKSISAPQDTLSIPQEDVSTPTETMLETLETVSVPKRDVKATKETISVTQETVSAPKRDVSAPKETASAAQDTLSIPQKDVSAPAKSISVALDTMSVLQKDVSPPAETISETLETVSVHKRDVTATKETVSSPEEILSVPQKDVSAPAKSISETLETVSVLPKDVSTPAETISETLETVSVPKRDVTATKETTSVTQETVSIPKRDVSAPKETVSAPQEMLSVPQKDVSARKETISVTRDTVSIPKRDVSAPKETVSAPQEMLSVPQKDVSAPAKSISVALDTMSVLQKDVSPPAETISETLETVSVPKRDVTATKETTSVTQETVSIPKRDVSAPKETVSAPQEMLSVPQKDVSARKETISVTRDTVSIPKRDVSAPKETVSAPQEMLSLPEKDVSAPAKSISAPHDTLSIPQEDVSTPAETISETLETVSVPKRDVTATKETTSVTQETVSIPKRDVSAPKETVSAPQEMLSVPQKDVSARKETISVTRDTVSIPKRDVSAPKETVSAPQEMLSLPEKDVSAPAKSISAPHDTLSIPQEDVSTPAETISETLETVSVPKRDVTATKETISVTQETVSVPKRDVSAPKETVSAPQEMLSLPEKDVSAPAKSISVALDTMSVLQKDVSTPAKTISETLETVSVPKRDVSSPKETVSATQEKVSVPKRDVSARKVTVSAPQDTLSIPQEDVPTPTETILETLETVSVPKRDVKATKETISVTQETVSVPKRDVSAPKETISAIQETVSVPKRDVSAPKETTSVTQETVLIHQKDVSAPTEPMSVMHDALSVAKRDMSTSKETISVTEERMSFPMMDMSATKETISVTQETIPAPNETVRAPQEMLSVPQKDVSSRKETTPVIRDTVSVPKRDVSAPTKTTSITQETVSVRQNDVLAPTESISITHDALSTAKRDVSTPKETVSVTEETLSVPKRDVSATKETTPVTQDTASVPKRDVSAPNESTSVTQDTMSVAQKDLSAPVDNISVTRDTVSLPNRDVPATKDTPSATQDIVSVTKETTSITQETVSGPQGDVSSPAKTMSVTHHTLTLVKRDEFATKETISEPKETVSVPHKDASVPFQTVPLGQQSVGIPLEPLAVPPMHVPVSGGPWVEQGLQPLCDLTTQVRAWLESAHGSLSDMLPGAPMPGGIEEQLLTCQGACEEMEKNVSSLYSLSPQDLAETRRWIVTLLSALDQLKSSLLPLLQLSEHSCQIQSDLQCGVLVQEGGLEHTVSNPELLTTLKIQSIQQEKELQLELKEQRDLAVALQHYSSQGWLQRATQEHKAQLLTRSNTGAEGDATAQERRPQVHGQLEATLAALDGTGSTWQDVLASGNAGKPVTWSMPAILRREAIQLEDLLNTACTSLQSQQGALQEQLDQQLQYEQRLHGLASLVELGWERLTRSQHVQLRSQDELQGLLSSHKTFFQKLASHLAMVQRLSQRLSATGLQTQAGAQTEAQAEAQAALEQDARTLQQRAVQQGVRLQDGLQAWSQWQESCGWIAKLLHDLEARMPSSTGPGHEDQEEQLQQTLCVCEQVSKALEESRAPLGAAVEQGQALQAGGFGSTVGAALRELQSRWNAVHHCAEREQLRVSAFTHLWARFCSDSVALGDWLGRARERLESWRRRCDATPPQQEHVRQRLANFLDFTKEVEARSSLKASVISTGEQLLQLKRCGDAGTLREQLTQLEQGWAEILSTLPSVQDWLHQQLMEKLHPSEAMTELGVWMDAMEKRLKEDHQEIRQASSAAGLQPLLQRYKEYQVEMACHQLTVDTLDQSVSQPSGIDLPATRYELALHAEKLGALNLRWLRLKGALCSQVQLLEQNLQTCLARDERLRVLGGGLSRQREKLSQVERPSSRSQAREALQECGDTEEKLKDTEAQLQELREVCLSDTDGELRRHCTCSEQLDMLRRDCADLRQQVTALRPRLQGALDLWGLVTKGLAEIALHTTKSQYSLEQGTHAQFSQHALQDHVDELQLLQVEAGGAEEKWEALNQNFSNLRDVISPAAAQLLSEQIEKQKIRWAAVSQEVAGALPRAQELLGLWRRFSGAFMSCSQSLQVHQERASFLLAAWPGRQHTAEQVVKRLEASRMQQQSLQVLQRSMEEVMETSKHLTGHMNVPASIFIQSEGWMLSCELLKLREALARREGHLQEELQELQKFTSSLASLELHLCSCQSRLTSGADSAPQSVLQDLGSLGPELEALNWKGDMLPQGDPAGDRLQALNRQWSVTFSQAAQVYSELQQGAVGQQSFQLLCQGWEAFLQSMEDSLARQEPLCSPSLREQLAVLQKLRVELPRGDQLLWSVLREGQGLLESLEAEQRHDLALQLTHMREHWHSVLVRVQQHGALLRALVRYWQLYIHGTNELRALLSQTDTLLPPTGPAHCSLRELRWSLHDLKYAEDQVGHRRAVYRQTMQIGWQLCSASDAQTQAQLQTELRLLQEDWERTESLLEKRRALTEAVLQNWERYKARLADSGERLEEVRNRLKQPLPECLEEIRVTEKITKEQEEALQHWAHDLTELAAMKTELSQYVTGKDGGPPDEAAEDLQLQWEELCAKVSLRKQEIADRLSAWVIFNKKNRELCEWLTQMESKVTHRADISLDDMMEKLKKDFMEEINLFSENKIHLNRLAEQLLSASDQAQGAEASDRMADVNARWQCLLDHIEARVRKLKETRSTVRQLDMDMNPLRVWLCRTEATLATPVTYSICHQDEIQGKLAEQQDLQRDVEQHAESVASMLTVCEGLLGDSEGCGTETERKSLQETARCLEQRWRNICTRALERRARIDGTWQLWCSFLDDHSHFDSWLKAAEHTAANPESANVPYASAKEELKKFEAFQRQVQERLAQLERLNKQYCQLAREHRTDSADRLRHMAWEVNRRWDELESRVAAILRRLRHFTSQREEFEGMREGLLVWLTEMDLQLTTVEHFSESDVQDKMRQLNDFQQEITLNTSKIDQLIVFGENLIQKSAAPDAVAIEDELEELHSYCQEVFGRVGRFHQRLTSLQQVVQEQQHQQEDLEEEARPARGGGLLSISQERSDRDTPVSVESIPLEWDHAVDVGPHQRKGEEEEEEEEEATFYSALSGRSETEASWHSPEHTETGGPYPDVIHTQASGPLDTSVPLKEGYVDLMLECSGTVASVERVSLILNSPEHPDDVGLTGISAADKQSGVIKRWELLQAQARGVELEAGRDLRGQQLTSDLEGVAAWLGQVQCELERLKSKPSASVQDMEAHVRQLKEMQHSFASYKTMIISANLRARELQQSEAVAARDLQGALCSVNQGWKEACAGLEAWEEDLRSALLWCQEFHTTLHSLLLWLAHAESRRFAVDMQDPSLSQAALLEQQANLRGLEAELLSRQQQVESLQEISSQLLPEAAMAEEEYAEAREKVHVVGRKLHTLLQLVDGDLHVLQERLVSCPPPESAADVVPGEQGEVQEVKLAAEGTPPEATSRRQAREQSPPRSFFQRVLRATFPLHVLFLLLLVLACLVYPFPQLRSFHPMLHYTNGPPPT
ncbi:nesprin-2 isoform X10 [Brienomyrus brachyistius]|uniref:nesprin-2 isoform X10 n=1 Tax=Brienomyrus brachyistius TaxID=42636 RepID=UPI0020B307AA|nr:nesprin-2 isoform X10 [Brienomyrus brachyistius]